jgi:uncharacterized protein
MPINTATTPQQSLQPSRRPHLPERSCVACRRKRPQHELLCLKRRAGTEPLGVVIDAQRRLPGRGAYVCLDSPQCRSAKALKRFARAQAELLAAALSAFFLNKQQ